MGARKFFRDDGCSVADVIRLVPVRPPEASRTWRSAKQAAVKRHGAGPVADRVALQAVRRFFKWLAKHPRKHSDATKPEPAVDSPLVATPARPR